MSAIKFDHVSFSYNNKKEVISDISFEISKGKTTMLLGKNGSGKTTLLKLLMNFEKPQNGTIYLYNKNINDYTIIDKSKEMSYVGQDIFNQFDFTVEDYLLFGVTNALSMFQLPDKKHLDLVKRFAHKFGIEHLMNKKMDQISGGEKQIVMICRAFIQNTEIIVMDEPLSALDFGNQNIILKLIKNLNKENKTIIFTTHNPNHALFLNANFIIIDKCKIVMHGIARENLTLEVLNKVYDGSIGLSKEHFYEEFSIKNDEV